MIIVVILFIIQNHVKNVLKIIAAFVIKKFLLLYIIIFAMLMIIGNANFVTTFHVVVVQYVIHILVNVNVVQYVIQLNVNAALNVIPFLVNVAQNVILFLANVVLNVIPFPVNAALFAIQENVFAVQIVKSILANAALNAT